MIIPKQVLERAERLNAENVSFVQNKDGFEVFRLLFKQPNIRQNNGSEIALKAGLPIVVLYKDGASLIAKSTEHEYWLG
jgi:hypothetical protein